MKKENVLFLQVVKYPLFYVWCIAAIWNKEIVSIYIT